MAATVFPKSEDGKGSIWRKDESFVLMVSWSLRSLESRLPERERRIIAISTTKKKPHEKKLNHNWPSMKNECNTK